MKTITSGILGISLALAATSPYAEEEAQTYHIPPQALSQALTGFADRHNLKLMYDSDLAQGLPTRGVNGTMGRDAALRKLLEGSGLEYRYTAPGTVTLVKPTPSRAPAPAKMPDRSDSSDATVLPVVTVTGNTGYASNDPFNPSYTRSNTSTATKTDTPIMETPFSIQVVPRQVLKDVQAVRPGDALNYVSGIYQGAANSGDWLDWSKRRGFDSFPTGDYRDGGVFPLASVWGGRDLANIDAVEVLKGPSSMLYGMATPGGVINYVTKKPLATPYYSLQQQFGSYSFYRTTLDATGPVTSDKSLLYRFNLAYKDAGSFRDLVGSDRIFIAPVVTWNMSPQTQVNFEMEYDNGHIVFDRGIPAIGRRPADVPRSRFLGEANPQSEFERILVGVNWTHAFNDDWKLMHRFTAVYSGISQNAAIPLGVNPNNGTLNRLVSIVEQSPGDNAAYFNTINLTGHFDTWGLHHTLLLGGDYFRNFRQATQQNFPSAIDIFNPVYLGPQGIRNKLESTPAIRSSTFEQWYGLYLQDQITLPYNLHMLAGFRYDSAETQSTFNKVYRETPMTDNLSPRGGLVWQPLPELSLYGSYSENFTGINGIGLGGTILNPETAQQWEFGTKTELFDKRFMATLAWFDLTRQNATIPDPRNPLYSAAIGEANVAGLEVDLKGEILPGWSMIGSYAYTPEAKTTAGTASQVGRRFPGVPKHGGSLFTTYELQTGMLQGLKFGGGVIVRSSQTTEGDNNDVVLPGYATLNLLTSYSWSVHGSRLTAQVNANNLLDKAYFPAAAFSRNAIEVGAPRTFMGSVRVEY